MNKRGIIARTAAGALGGLLLIGGAGAAIADTLDDDNVDVKVDIAPIQPVGALTFSVAADSTTLTEEGSTDTIRQFKGSLPEVTVTDDRAEVPAGVFWYVTGQASDFTGPGGATISAGHLGWAPKLLTAEGDGEVAEGPEVGTVLDPQADPNNVGVVGEELLALALDSQDAATVGEWKASADLTLKTPKNVTPGAYTSKLTLTLWEDEQ
ncbi:hypothetical protein G5T42_09155 [Microbacterium sp. 4R-513]|uniref:hypothetical protein n=1 Tax=Microbacterium sp. 4R-513 TaxID=2567934 RepID=UPI0013E1F638|nr:hypothetical protein [Microbacterium sp. 4R-513]QIG39634.1 hypothetical protein G5T42_09155 [Microbacterium sp. 4R-513]